MGLEQPLFTACGEELPLLPVASWSPSPSQTLALALSYCVVVVVCCVSCMRLSIRIRVKIRSDVVAGVLEGRSICSMASRGVSGQQASPKCEEIMELLGHVPGESRSTYCIPWYITCLSVGCKE